MIEIFEITPPNELPNKVKECIDHFKTENPALSGNISGIASYLKIMEIARDVWFLETIEKQSDMSLSIMAIGRSLKRSLIATLDE